MGRRSARRTLRGHRELRRPPLANPGLGRPPDEPPYFLPCNFYQHPPNFTGTWRGGWPAGARHPGVRSSAPEPGDPEEVVCVRVGMHAGQRGQEPEHWGATHPWPGPWLATSSPQRPSCVFSSEEASATPGVGHRGRVGCSYGGAMAAPYSTRPSPLRPTPGVAVASSELKTQGGSLGA